MAPFNLKKFRTQRKKPEKTNKHEQSFPPHQNTREATSRAGLPLLEASPGLVPRTAPLNQDLSPLFKCLPVELRQQIYGAIFGGGVCHIVAWQAGEVLGNIRCSGSVAESAFRIDNPCWGHFWAIEQSPLNRGHNSQLPSGAVRALSLLLACRRIYAEAIELLYSRTRFFFTGPDIVNVFTSKVPRQFHQCISFIEITAPSIYALKYPPTPNDTDKPHPYDQWTLCINKLSQMHNLKALYVVVPNSKPYDQWRHGVEDERTILEALLQLRYVRQVVVALAWYSRDGGIVSNEDEEAKRYPFKLRRFENQQHLPQDGL